MERLAVKTSVMQNVEYFVKWTVISCVIGVIGGMVGSIFGIGIRYVTSLFQTYDWVLFLLPVSGLAIVFLYHITGQEKHRGTNMVLDSISSNEEITPATGPLIFISTILTHLAGGSAGREGAALQLGGSIGSMLGKAIHLDEKDRKIAVMCGMSACFGALFGTPLAAGVFSMEVISIGIMYYAALVPCVFAAFVGAGMAQLMGLSGERFTIQEIPAFELRSAVIIVAVGVLCALVSILLCLVLHTSEHIYEHYFENPYIRILAASAILIGMTLILGTRAYNGSSMALIEEAMEGHVRYEAFLLKMMFTAVTLGAGYKGGEIVPTLCVGATFGCAVGTILGFSPSLCAACGMVCLFAGVTNCPITSLIIALEMCGAGAMPYFGIAIAVTFTLSGYYGLYKSQKFAYSKTRTEYINRKAN